MSNKNVNFTPPRAPQAAGGETQQQTTGYAAPQAAAGVAPQSNVSLTSLGSLFSMNLPTGGGSVSLSKATEAFNDLINNELKSYLSNVDVSVYPLDHTVNNRAPMSAVVVSLMYPREPELGIGVYTFLLESSIEQFQDRSETFNNLNYSVQTLASDVYANDVDGVLVGEALAMVRRKYPNQDLFSCEATVVPKIFDFTDKQATQLLLVTGLKAIYEQLEPRRSTWHDVNLSALEDGKNNVIAQIKFARRDKQKTDATGMPVRSDIRLSLQLPVRATAHTAVTSKVITEASAFMDLRWAGNQPAQQLNPYMQQQSGPFYAPRLVLTQLAGVQTSTIASQLLALAATATFYHGNLALSSLYPDLKNPDEKKFYDIGVLNLETQVNGKAEWLDVYSTNNMAEIVGYASRLFHPIFDLALDVSDCGPDTWINSPFREAALGKMDAQRAIIDAANTLTNGLFSQAMGGSNAIAYLDSVVQLGYYEAQGQLRDIRDVDYLAVATRFLADSPMRLQEYSNLTVPNASVPQGYRLHELRRIREEILGTNVTYTGYGKRIVFTGEFMQALVSSVAAAGLTISPQAQQVFEQQQRLSVGAPAGYDMSSATQSLFRAGYGQAQSQPGQAYATNQYSRWTR